MPPISMEIYIPSLPTIERKLHTSTEMVLATISLYTIAFGVMQLLLGPFSDVYGRRGLLLVSLSLYVVACVAVALSPTVGFMLPPRVIQGSTSAAVLIVGQAMLRDLLSLSRRERVTSWMAVVRSTSPLLAPVIGSLLQACCGWRSTFWALTLLGVFGLALSWRLLPESLPRERRQKSFSPRSIAGAVAFLCCRRDFTCWAVPEALGFAGFFVWISTSSYILQGMAVGLELTRRPLLLCHPRELEPPA